MMKVTIVDMKTGNTVVNEEYDTVLFAGTDSKDDKGNTPVVTYGEAINVCSMFSVFMANIAKLLTAPLLEAAVMVAGQHIEREKQA